MSVLLELVCFIPGCVFFPGSFVCLRKYFRCRLQARQKFQNDDIEGLATAVAMRLTSVWNALFMIMTGLITITTIGEDITNDKSPVLVPYCYMGVPYMFYDVYAMFITYQFEKPHIRKQSLFRQILSYYLESPMITTHHLMVGILLYPLVLYFLDGKGDFILGIYFLTECSTPFLSFRYIMKKLKLNMPTLFLVNDICILVIFFCCRILMIPFSYWMYGRNVNVAFLDVPFVIPRMCNILNFIIFIMQLVWFWMIVKAAARVISKFGKPSPSQESNGKLRVEEVNSNHMHNKAD
ncbi:TLC domain-containing protein 3A-like [Amphiura filiformis]|uniref:TLC domain-containing protein 3A-like n=1 Tax=Amphiura filiformis TaxID=82378 RepID=UPI003B228E23